MGSSNAPRWLSEVTSMLLRTCQLQSSPLIPNIWHASKFVSKLPPPQKASWETFIDFRRWETQKPEGGCRNSRFRAQDLTEVVPETRNFCSFKYQTYHKVCGSEFGAWSSFIPNFGTNRSFRILWDDLGLLVSQEAKSMRGDRTRDQSIKSRTLYQTELARLANYMPTKK